jgi:hypothetical protein
VKVAGVKEVEIMTAVEDMTEMEVMKNGIREDKGEAA